MRDWNFYLDVYLLKKQGVSLKKLCQIYQRSKSWLTYVLRQGRYYFQKLNQKKLKNLIDYRLSALIITKNDTDWLLRCLQCLDKFNDVVIVNGQVAYNNTTSLSLSLIITNFLKSTKKLKNFPVIKLISGEFSNIGSQRLAGLPYTTGKWLLILDTDELVSKKLNKEIRRVIKSNQYTGYYLPYQNHLFNIPLYYGGEDYQMLRLFRKDCLKIEPEIIHNRFFLTKGKAGYLKNKLFHYSYRSLKQMFLKFSYYGYLTAKLRVKDQEKLTLKKLTLYPIHMFYSRYIKDKGYKDTPLRLILDLFFAYMEFLSYFLMIFVKEKEDVNV